MGARARHARARRAVERGRDPAALRRAHRPARRRGDRRAVRRPRTPAPGARRGALPRRPHGPAARTAGHLHRRALGPPRAGRGRPAARRRRRRAVARPGVRGCAWRTPRGGWSASPSPSCSARRPGRRNALENAFPDQHAERLHRRADQPRRHPAAPGGAAGAAAPPPPLAADLRHHDGQPALRAGDGPDAGGARPRQPRETCPCPTTSRTCSACGSPTSTTPRAACCWRSRSTPTSASPSCPTPPASRPCRRRSTRAWSSSRATGSGPLTRSSPPRPRSRRPTRRSARCTAGSPTWSPTSSERALHLALATTGHDEALAARLDAATAAAAARGATRLAIDLAAHAWRLTPPEVSDVDRVLALGRHLHDAGEKQRLTELLGDRVESLPPGAPRVTAYLLLTEGMLEQGSAEIVALLEKALAEAGDDPVLRGQVLSYIAENEAVVEVREVARADERATEAVALSKQGSPDDQRLALNTLTWTQALRGRPVAHLVERLLRAVDRACLHGPPPRAHRRAAPRSGAGRSISRAPCSRRSSTTPRSGRRPTRWPGCTCASWSCARAGGTTSSGCSTTGPPRPTARC